jgi:alkylhydroperoxidase/carboxymuconolactone decarboxylase family protein YurZ
VTRLPQRTVADTNGDTARVLGKLESRGVLLPIARTVANSAHAFRPFILMSDALLRRASLPARTRELVILALAAELEAGYEWEEHVPMSAAAGVTDQEREALAAGFAADLEGLAPSERLALDVAEQLLRRRSIDGETWAMVEETWDAEVALELLLTVAWWGAFVPTVIGALDLHASDARGATPAA